MIDKNGTGPSSRRAPGGRPGRWAHGLGLAAGIWLAAAAAAPALAGKVETWRHETASALGKGKKQGVVISDAGRVRLGQTLKPTETLDAARVWDLARTGDNTLYAATGDAGRVFRREGDGPWTLVYDAADTQALCLAVGPKGHVFVGTGPSGQVIDLTDASHPAARPDRSVQYIWDLAADPAGNLYAATGPTGQLWKRSEDGKWSLLLDSKQSHLLSVAVGPDGSVYTGSDGQGLIYRVAAEGKTSVLYDAAQSDIRTLLFAPDGALYAGTASESGSSSSGSARGTLSFSRDEPPPGGGPPSRTLAELQARSLESLKQSCIVIELSADGTIKIDGEPATRSQLSDRLRAAREAHRGRPVAVQADVTATTQNDVERVFTAAKDLGMPMFLAPAQVPGRPPSPAGEGRARSSTPGGSAAPRPATPGDNAVYRIGSDGAAREVFRARVMIFALAWQDDRLLVGTGPEGQLYEVRDMGRESAPIARLDHGQILALLAGSQDDLLIGTGDPGSVARLAAGYLPTGTLTSDVLDAKYLSRFGALSWRTDLPPGTAVSFQVRTGNVSEPDSTWSAWSAAQTDPTSATAGAPAGRFAQYKATLSTSDPTASPVLRSVALRYQTVNLPPEINKIDVPDLSEADGASRQTKLSLRWDVSDPNGDDMVYTLHIRKEGWPDWVKLGEEPITEKSFSWDTTAVPAGLYRVRVTASDRPSNDPDDALSRDRISEPFLVDHQAPTVSVVAKAPTSATVILKDELTRLVKAAYALDGGEWVPIFPDDGLFDTPRETITIKLADLKPGTHVLTVRATDAAGNVGAGDTVFRAP